jgi:hypothetical protein
MAEITAEIITNTLGVHTKLGKIAYNRGVAVVFFLSINDVPFNLTYRSIRSALATLFSGENTAIVPCECAGQSNASMNSLDYTASLQQARGNGSPAKESTIWSCTY